MQAAHPGRVRGLLRRTPASLDDPYERLRRTAAGHRTRSASATSAEADRPTRARARACTGASAATCAEPPGRFPAGTPWAADDPELLLWILACLADSALVVYERYVGR